MKEHEIIKRIEEDLRLGSENNVKEIPNVMDSKWKLLTATEPKKFINEDLTLNINAIRNFRKLCIFVPDQPDRNPSFFNIINLISGGQRGSKRLLKESLLYLKRGNYLNLLKKYPCVPAGNPNVFKYNGYSYTLRWLRHIIFLGLFKEFLEPRLKEEFITLDIGSSYGIFSYLISKEFPNSHNILIDFPEQLALAHYFLGISFPEARIAGYKEIFRLDSISKDFIKNYDFILIPYFFYKRIIPKSIDLITNFASLGEMKREWFNFYLKSDLFYSTKYFFTVNRFQSAPTFDTDLTILDYPLLEFKKIDFKICDFFTYAYFRKYLFLYKKENFPSQYFEFIGDRLSVR